MDRPKWAGNKAPHPFNLNGLYYNPNKDYGDQQERSGPKPAAYAHVALEVLTQDLEPADLAWVEAANGVTAVELGARATVFWAEEATLHPLKSEGAVLSLSEMQTLDIQTMSLDVLLESGTRLSSVALPAHEPMVVLWDEDADLPL